MSEQAKRLDAFLNNNSISASERSFGASLKKSVTNYGKMTERQWSAFQRMEARHSPEVKAARKQWEQDWTEEKAKNLRTAAEYYLCNPPYFGEAARTIIADPTYIPSQKLYHKMVENKYVQKVLTTLATEPLYPVGSLVQVRKTAREYAYKLRDRQALVVMNDGVVKSAAKGARTYTILPFGESGTITIEERWLKRAPRAK